MVECWSYFWWRQFEIEIDVKLTEHVQLFRNVTDVAKRTEKHIKLISSFLHSASDGNILHKLVPCSAAGSVNNECIFQCHKIYRRGCFEQCYILQLNDLSFNKSRSCLKSVGGPPRNTSRDLGLSLVIPGTLDVYHVTSACDVADVITVLPVVADITRFRSMRSQHQSSSSHDAWFRERSGTFFAGRTCRTQDVSIRRRILSLFVGVFQRSAVLAAQALNRLLKTNIAFASTSMKSD